MELKLFDSERKVMEVLWDHGDLSAKELADRLKELVGWSKTTTYTVKSGDCLWNIAKKYLGDGSRYTEIYNLNKDKIKNPNLIYPNQVLTLPS